ncbi:MAG: hypothetical protein ABI197_11455 [Granulicella sp.]
MKKDTLINLSQQEIALYRRCVNEVLAGFHAPSMEQTVGVSYAILMKEDAAFYALRKSSGDTGNNDLSIPVRPLVIAEAIRQFAEDFQARTGSPVEEGYRLLEKAKKAS